MFHRCLVILCCLLSLAAQAKTREARITAVSSSNQSAALNLGSFDGIRVGDRLKLFVPQKRSLKDNPTLKVKAQVLAIAEAIRVDESSSYWRLKRLGGRGSYTGALVPGLKLRVMNFKKDPRRPFVARQTISVENRATDQKVYSVDDAAGVPEDLIFEEGKYSELAKVSKTRPTKKQDVEVIVKKGWVPSSDELDEEFEDTFLGKVTPAFGDFAISDSVKQELAFEVWDKTTDGVNEKYNSLKYGLNGLYRDSVDDIGTNTNEQIDAFDLKSDDEKIQLDKVAVKNALKRIKRDPYRWSQDMSDEELRRFVVESGIVSEVQAQKKALRTKLSHEVVLRYGTPFQSSSVIEDDTTQGLGYSLGIAYELALAHFSDEWKNFALEFEFEGAISYHNLGNVNGRFSETTGRLHANWYFLRPPTSIETLMPFASLGIRRGVASAESNSVDDSLSFDTSSLFAARLGVKYRIKAGDGRTERIRFGYGLHALIGYESTNYNLKNVNAVSDDFFSQFSSGQIRFSLGLNTYF